MSRIQGVVTMAIAAVMIVVQGAVAQPGVTHLRCENLYNPLGIDRPQPRLSWMLTPGPRGLAQSAYQVIVTADDPKVAPGEEKVLWDSGKVVSDQSSFVPYGGEPLVSGARCYWKVRTWDQDGKESAWSEQAYFTVGPITMADWKGEWIGCDWMENNEGPLPLLHKMVTLSEQPARAEAHICVLGYYELYVNGRKAGDEVLVPAVSDYAKRGLYTTLDLSEYLKAGENCIGLWLGRGWSTAILEPASKQGPVVKAQVKITYADGATLMIPTDATWKAHPSHITPLGKGSSGDYGGELVEAAKEVRDWSTAGFDDSAWQPATIHHPPTPLIEAQMMEGNCLLDEVLPVSVSPLEDGFLVDMGRNYTGWFELRMPDELEAGARVDLAYADKRFPDGKFQTYNQRDTYVARGGGGESFRNRFNYHAFRYAIVNGMPRAPKLDEIKGNLVSTDYNRAAEFSCDHSLLNDIYNMVVWTHRCLSLGGYTVDCPHRERLGYGGDSGTSMEAAMLNFRSGPFYAKWAADWRLSQAEDGDLPHTAPNSQQAGGGPVWSGFAITMPWMVYTYYGDKAVLEQGWPVMQNWLAFIETKMGDGILQPYSGIGCNMEWSFLGDWVPPGRKQGKDRVDDHSTLFFNNCYLVHCLQLASKIGAVLGKADDAARYAAQAEALAARLHEKFLNPDGATYANGEQTYLAMPLLFNVTPDTHRAQVLAALEKDIVETRKGHLNTGMHGNYYMARLLIDERRNDLLTLMHTQETFPSYGNMLKNGATTILEEWDGDNSQIHNTMISIGMWFIRGLGGIQADDAHPGLKHFIAAPGVESGLKHVTAKHLSEYGWISSAWKREGNTITYDLEVPPNSTARVILPAAALDAVQEGGGPVVEQPGISNAACENGLFRCDVASGNYQFVVPMSE
ncbi:MAG: family 78 glycoside hydrolase catalytic domain [Candidatus Hydrogenedentes bacterium]|nr:family 78 glycoside hydrolase catalytic domain [Candidatus Hydrogenedentota bacterium]